VSKARIMKLVELVNSLTREQSAAYVGKTVEILCEDYDDKKEMYLGRDEYGRMGYFKSEKYVVGQFVSMKVDSANGVSLMGHLVENEEA
jgi:tRNA-2-methylthio-N6-dimethylallyladenosine synthase